MVLLMFLPGKLPAESSGSPGSDAYLTAAVIRQILS